MLNNINTEFWLGQIFTLVATVVGVYLAANSGFNKAIEFENLQHQRNAYHVQRSLLLELEANLAELKTWVDEFDKDPEHNNMDLRQEKYQLDMFLWQTTQEGSEIFEVPYQYVNAISGFYGKAEYLRTVLLSGNPFESPKASAKLRSLVAEQGVGLVSDFRSHLNQEQTHLTKTGLL